MAADRKRGVLQEPTFYRTRINEWPEDERPREKLLKHGPAALSDADLLTILIRTGTGKFSALDLAKGVLHQYKGLRGVGSRSAIELMQIKGIGKAKAVELLAAFEIGRRVQTKTEEERTVIRSPEDVAKLLGPRLRDLTVEKFYVLALDAKNAVREEEELTKGTLNASLVHPREVFKVAIDHRAAAVIVVHNHPSGNLEPSREDIEITHQLVEAGKVIGIPLHDHLIIAGNGYTSFAERGLIP
ncbi:MAG: DNA repair protein RadC [Bacteroidota bacterium]